MQNGSNFFGILYVIKAISTIKKMSLNKIRVALYMSNMSIPDKLKRSRVVQSAISANAQVFISAGAELSRLANATTELETAWGDAYDNGKRLKAIMRNKEHDFDVAMTRLAAYVEMIADGNPAIIYLAGMEVRPFKGPSARAAFEAKRGNETGAIVLKARLMKGSVYIWEYSIDEVTWINAGAGTRSRKEIKNLSPGNRYWFRYARIDKDGHHPFSAAVSLIVV
jgi:hypothetical protein